MSSYCSSYVPSRALAWALALHDLQLQFQRELGPVRAAAEGKDEEDAAQRPRGFRTT